MHSEKKKKTLATQGWLAGEDSPSTNQPTNQCDLPFQSQPNRSGRQVIFKVKVLEINVGFQSIIEPRVGCLTRVTFLAMLGDV